MTDRERVVEMADECRKRGHAEVSYCVPCVPCILRFVTEVRQEGVRQLAAALSGGHDATS